MPKLAANQIVASAAGLSVSVGLVTFAAYWFSPRAEFLASALWGTAIATLATLTAWSGVLWKAADAPSSWSGWLGISAMALLFGAASVVLIDCANHDPFARNSLFCGEPPGSFTLISVSLSVVAMASAVRVWVLDALSKYTFEARRRET